MLVAFYCLRHSPPPLLIMQYISRFRFSAAIAAKCTLPDLKCKKGRLPPPRFQYFPVQPPSHCRERRPRRPSFCRAGPMCPAAGYCLCPGGAHGPRTRLLVGKRPSVTPPAGRAMCRALQCRPPPDRAPPETASPLRRCWRRIYRQRRRHHSPAPSAPPAPAA